jgi:hypothetical protein
LRESRLHGRPLDAKLLAIDSSVQRLKVERVVREDGQRGDGVTDAAIGGMQ